MTTLIRAYAPDDCDTLAGIYRRAIREIAAKDYTPEQIQAWAPDSFDMERFAARLESQPTFVAEENGQIAGFAGPFTDGHIDFFFINPDFKGRGMARALLEHILALAQERKLPRVHAEVSRTARGFFEKHGFTVTQAQLVELRGQKLQNFKMERRL